MPTSFSDIYHLYWGDVHIVNPNFNEVELTPTTTFNESDEIIQKLFGGEATFELTGTCGNVQRLIYLLTGKRFCNNNWLKCHGYPMNRRRALQKVRRNWYA